MSVAILLNRRIRFDLVHCVLGIGKPLVVTVYGAVHDHLVGAASLDGDIARARGEIEVNHAGDRKRTIEMPFDTSMQQNWD